MGEEQQEKKFYFALAKDVEEGTTEWKEMSVSSDFLTTCLDAEPKNEDGVGDWAKPASYTFTASVDVEASDSLLLMMRRMERKRKQYDVLRESPQDMIRLYSCCIYRQKPSRKLRRKYSELVKELPHMRLTLAYHLTSLCASKPKFLLGRWTLMSLLLPDIEEIRAKMGK